MHDCRQFENRLIDLIFDELEADQKQATLAELESCDACLGQYRSMKETLLVFDKTVEASLPDESFWHRHHVALRQRLETFALPAKTLRAPFWKRALIAKLPLPVPVAAAIAIALLVSTVLALRPKSAETIQPAPQAEAASTTLPKVIEVPVFREKVVTRTVYVEKRSRENNSTRRQAPVVERKGSSLMARNSEKEEVQGSLFTRVKLTDFQPPDEMKIRIIRRSNSDEN